MRVWHGQHRYRLVSSASVAALPVACGDDGPPDPTDATPAVRSSDPGPVHIHALGVNPKDGALFIATHTGLFRAPAGKRAANRVANRWQDMMGFTVVGTPFSRARAGAAAVGAAVLGVAPHVLHHVGPLAGAALLAGVGGRLLFGALAFVLAVPMLMRLRRRSGSWRLPAGVLALMAVVFTASTLWIGPALAGDDEPERDGTAPVERKGPAHDAHHP